MCKCVKNCIATGDIGIADVDAELHAAGNAVNGAGEYVAHTDGRYRITRTAMAGRIFDRQNQFSGRPESIFTIFHENCASVSTCPLNEYPEAGWSREPGPNSPWNSSLFVQWPLLDVDFEESLVVVRRQFHFFKVSGETWIPPPLLDRV